MKNTFRTEEDLKLSAPNAGHRDRFLERLEKEEKRNSGVRWMPWLLGVSSAAAVLWAVFAISISNQSEITAETEPDTYESFNAMTALNDRSAKLENIYIQHVESKIPAVLKERPELKAQLELLDKLDAEYAKLKTLFIKTEGHSAITKEMIRNHKLRLQLMEQMLHQIELIKSKKSTKNEIKSA